jgi:DMSO/TMAO reductase YedYZ heme-binding membrane subunit
MKHVMGSGLNSYENFFEPGKMNLTGELSMLLGIIAFMIFTITTYSSFFAMESAQNAAAEKKAVLYRYLTQFLVMGHLLVMGVESWFLPSTWPGYLLPISFLSFLVLLFIMPVSMQRRLGSQNNRS